MKKITYLIILLIVSACAVSKAEKYLKEGKTLQQNFKETIPFEIKKGLIILKAKINNKSYNFILDTGASNVISKELATELNMKVIGSESIYDIYNVEQKTDYTRINNIQIGTIDFTQTIAAITDFNSVPAWVSMKIDGFIGSNLMQHAIWDFNFETNIITITNDESKLNLPKDIIENKLFIGYAGIPSVTTKINGKKVWNFTVDFGFNGAINIPFSEFEKQKENGNISDYKKYKNQGVIGIYRKQSKIRESYIGTINEIEFGNSILKKEKVYSEKYLNHLFGLDFFRNYRVILNWKNKKIKLIENTEGYKLK
ncbi:retroviral-like aspartic protease family protein [Tenacibaculum dicentrarchi]|nr:retroviral-like aspartic protease family protein [Tenacibaculum dicentrarchi]